MKKIYFVILLLVGMATATTVTSCSSDDDPISTAQASDDPRILDPIFPDRVNGELPVVATVNRDQNFSMKLTVTPADYTTCTWYIDGTEVFTGNEIDQPLEAGTYTVKVVAATEAGKSTYREGIVKVNALDGDPATVTKSFERIVSPGAVARLYGSNLSKVKAVKIGDKTATELDATADEDGEDCLEYLVPEGLANGSYRISLVDAAGDSYGGDIVEVTAKTLVTAGFNRANAGADWTLTGINLDRIASVSVGGQTVSSFKSQTAESLTLTCPQVEEGEHAVTAKTKDGESVMFYVGGQQVESATVTISSELTLWEGHHYVSWDLPDGDPNKTFNLLSADVFAAMKPGSILKIYYSVEPTAEYHQLKVATGWWTDLRDKVEFSDDGVYEMTLTQNDLDLIAQQAGFLCVGHGYYVDRITKQ